MLYVQNIQANALLQLPKKQQKRNEDKQSPKHRFHPETVLFHHSCVTPEAKI